MNSLVVFGPRSVTFGVVVFLDLNENCLHDQFSLQLFRPEHVESLACSNYDRIIIQRTVRPHGSSALSVRQYGKVYCFTHFVFTKRYVVA